MAQELAVLRVYIDHKWTAYELAELISDLDELYSDFAVLEMIRQLVEKKTLVSNAQESILINYRLSELETAIDLDGGSRELLGTENKTDSELGIEKPPLLEVIKLQYGSEGALDFLGGLNPLNALRDIIIHWISTPEQRGKGAKLKEEARALGIKNLNDAIDSMRSQGVPEPVIQITYNRGMRKLGYKLPKYFDEKKMPRLPELAPAQQRHALPPPKPAQ